MDSSLMDFQQRFVEQTEQKYWYITQQTKQIKKETQFEPDSRETYLISN